ncbi:MAG TPA: hypothetical protein EYP22_05975 [Methanosarcinales archaeon]|nr:hypothetical protein [Methanosarcinales archaeon]
MVVSFEDAAAKLNMKKEKLAEEGLKAYLRARLRELRAEITKIYMRYGVFSLNELDEKINQGELSESDTFDDFTMLDYLEGEEEKIRNIMENLK